MKRWYTVVLCLLWSLETFAQSVEVKGRVLAANTHEPIFYALVYTSDTRIYTTTNDKGCFTLKIPVGKQTLHVAMLGYVTLEKEIEIKPSMDSLTLELQESSLNVDGVVVTARTSNSKEGTSTYTIGSDAIKQVQALSLSDVMSLLPGGKLETQRLSSVAQVNLRSTESSSVNSFGTAIIVDGAPISNDANMQALNPASGTSGGTNVAGRGVDLREIPASNIESVEVITGVASAKYGNITSGAVIVTRKAGYAPLNVTFNCTPSTYQGNISRGFRLNGKAGYLNLDLDYAYSASNPTERKYYYQRIGFGARWTSTFSERLDWSNTLSLNYGFNGDGQRREPEETLVNNRDVQNHRISLGINGNMKILGRLAYTLNASASPQYTFVESEQTDGPRPMVEPTESGTYFTTFTPLSYISQTEMKGLPVNIYGRLEADQRAEWLGQSFNFSTGVEYSFDKNYGEGRIVGGQSAGAAGLPGSRGMLFHNIPASKTFSAYHQMDISHEWSDNLRYILRLGLRYDNMLERYNLFSPRLSASLGFLKTLKVTAAWGISYKSPSMLTLFPGPVYFDLVNLSYYDPDPARRLAVVTSYVINPDNRSLKPGKGETTEFSLEWTPRSWNIRLTGYFKDLTDGISSKNTLVLLKNQSYRVVEEHEDTPPTVEPDPDKIFYVPRTYTEYVNTAMSFTRGLEFTITPPRIKATHTSFHLNGQWISSRSYDKIPTIRSSNTSVSKSRYGVYDSFVRLVKKANANLTIAQQIPSLRLMITLTTELNIFSRSEYESPSRYPIGYYDDTGNYVSIPESERSSQEYADLHLSEYDTSPTVYPFYSNFHLNIRKETRQGHAFTFYANNCFWYNPYYTDKYSHTTGRLNSQISFGFGITLKL